jgi:MoaA/NifB/PqqE/SkfB family radical SAM enzyme
MCSDWKNKHHGEITVEEIRQVFSNPLLKNLKWINVLGGEPTIRRDLPDIIQTIYENVNLRGLGLNTNGFVTKMIMQRVTGILEMSKANPKTRERCLNVVISMDGFGELHDRIRGVPGGFEKICNALERLKALRAGDPRLSVGLSCCVQPKNVHGLPELQDFAKERSVSISFFPMRFAHVFGNLHDRDNPLFRFSPSQVMAFKDFISSTDSYRSNNAV